MFNLWNCTKTEDDLDQEETAVKKPEDGDTITIVANRGKMEIFINGVFGGILFEDKELDKNNVMAAVEF